jgi:hypothetical protein
MRITCPISGLSYKAQYMSGNVTQCHPFYLLSPPKIPAILSIWQKGELSFEETHLLYTRLLLNTEHVIFSSPLLLTEALSEIENAQMIPLSKLVYSGCFQKDNIDLPSYNISEDTQDISELMGIWETELEQYRISYMISKQQHEIRAMLARVQRAFADPLVKNRKSIITNWMLKCCKLPQFKISHPITYKEISISDYWIELLSKAIEGDHMISYPEKDIVEFKSHLEEHLPLSYAQEFSLLEELRDAISRKQNYFGFSFVDADDKAYAVETVKPQLARKDFANVTEYLNAIKANRIHPKQSI